MRSMTDLLSQVPLYVGLQKAVGADTLRYRCLDAARIQPGDVVIDVGCGPAYYFERLPQPLTYHGFDTDSTYIEWARKKWGGRGTFHVGIFDPAAPQTCPRPTWCCCSGCCTTSATRRAATSSSSAPASCLRAAGSSRSTPPSSQPGRLSRWMSENDRGESCATRSSSRPWPTRTSTPRTADRLPRARRRCADDDDRLPDLLSSVNDTPLGPVAARARASCPRTSGRPADCRTARRCGVYVSEPGGCPSSPTTSAPWRPPCRCRSRPTSWSRTSRSRAPRRPCAPAAPAR